MCSGQRTPPGGSRSHGFLRHIPGKQGKISAFQERCSAPVRVLVPGPAFSLVCDVSATRVPSETRRRLVGEMLSTLSLPIQLRPSGGLSSWLHE